MPIAWKGKAWQPNRQRFGNNVAVRGFRGLCRRKVILVKPPDIGYQGDYGRAVHGSRSPTSNRRSDGTPAREDRAAGDSAGGGEERCVDLVECFSSDIAELPLPDARTGKGQKKKRRPGGRPGHTRHERPLSPREQVDKVWCYGPGWGPRRRQSGSPWTNIRGCSKRTCCRSCVKRSTIGHDCTATA